MPVDTAAVTFVSLLDRQRDAIDLARLIDSLVREDAGAIAATLVPEERGTSFFARGLGRDGTGNVFLVFNEEGLCDAARQTRGLFLVAHAPTSTAVLDPRWLTVSVPRDDAVLALGEALIRHFTTAQGDGARQLFDERAADLLKRLRGRARLETQAGRDVGMGTSAANIESVDHRGRAPRARPQLPSLLAGMDDVPQGVPTPDPFDLLIDSSAQRQPLIGRLDSPPSIEAPPARIRRRPSFTGQRDAARTGELASRLVARAPMIVVVGSRKGGVGKTSHAAGVAIVAGTVLDSVGHRAALVDANIANPDAWGHLPLPAEASTVRTLAAALAAGQEPPRPVNARTPALACYPETREGAEYSRTDIRRVAAHLRARFAFVIVDMSNRLPDPTAGPEAATAAYWLAEADALVLPTACSRQDFAAVLDYLDVEELPPVVVPCLVPTARRNRRHPLTRQYLGEIGHRVDRIVEMPDDADRVRLAGMEGVAVQSLSPSLRHAYRELTEAIVTLPTRSRR